MGSLNCRQIDGRAVPHGWELDYVVSQELLFWDAVKMRIDPFDGIYEHGRQLWSI